MSTGASVNSGLLSGRATHEGTLRYAARFMGRAAAGHFREAAGGLLVSSVGIGTYLGEPDEATDRAYADSIFFSVQTGFNFVDSAINYRFQRSERSVGAALKRLVASGFTRDEIVLCTKAGFLTPDGEMPPDPNEYFLHEYVKHEIFDPEEIAQGCHCMSPRYLKDQLERSRKNFGVECIDVFYLHNPETQLADLSREDFQARIRAAFEFLESAVAAGKIGAYGMATWNAFREDMQSPSYLSLAEMVSIAREVGGIDHHLRFVQLPFNLAMPEALTRPNQIVDGKTMATVQAVRPLGISLVTSAALLQGQLTQNLPPYIRGALGLSSDSALAIQFARSAPGVTTALVGMSRLEHVKANLSLVGVEPAHRDQFLKLFEPRG
ncbi:MAG TPA: aldo/keto reductase [Candidatus Limnocylindrales bacterium]|nr:aldo/keto reductase [Candidatus Limnocylindrales bacterium]